MTLKRNDDYKIVGKVLGQPFEHSVYSEDGYSNEDIIYHCMYMYSEGNYSCDCNKRDFSGLFDDDNTRCGDSIKYEELWLVHKDGSRIDLLKEGYFRND